MVEQDSTPQGRRRRKGTGQIGRRERRERTATRRKILKDEYEARKKALLPRREAFWDKYFHSQPSGMKARIANLLGMDPSAISGWVKGGGWHAEHISLLLDEKPALFDDAQARELIELSLLTNGYTKQSVQGITAQSERARLATLEAERAVRRKEVEWFSQVIMDTIHDLATRLSRVVKTGSMIGHEDEDAFVYAVLERICGFYDKLYGSDDAARACIYTPTSVDPDLLELKWNMRVDGAAKRWNRWYTGEEPIPAGKERGFPGSIWHQDEGEAIPDIWNDPKQRFRDQRNPPRTKETLKYCSLVQALIRSPEGKKLGLLSVDSKVHTFTELDFELMRHVVELLGYFMALTI